MTDDTPDDEPEGYEAFFVARSGWRPFLVFEEELSRLRELYVAQEYALQDHLETIQGGAASYARWSEEHPEHEAAGYLSENADFHKEWYLSAQEAYPLFVRSSALAFLFTLLEVLMDRLAMEAESIVGRERPNDSDRKLPYFDRNLLFLTRICAMGDPLTKRHRRHLDALRSYRNKLIHQLGRDLPASIEAQLDALFPSEQGRFHMDSQFIARAFQTIGEIASLVEGAYTKRFGPG